ncbi:hypothetical protein [Actinoplanes sp. NPDC051411]|uniref:hypothetical protein n=1 Tax=Actinoplanes sp. NPDC051411 TaxID=3155522 RepID=UPI00341A04E8
MRPGDHHAEHGDNQSCPQHQHQGRRAIGQRLATAHAEGVQNHQDDGVDGDAAEDVADATPTLPATAAMKINTSHGTPSPDMKSP